MRGLSAICISLTALVSLVFFFTLFLAIRCEEDDMILSLDLREHSLFYLLQTRYLFSSFRTTLLVLDGLLISYSDPQVYKVTLFGFYAGLFTFLVFILHRFTCDVLGAATNSMRDKLLLAAICISQAGAIYFLCTNRMEVFAWLCASAVHLLPVIFCLYVCWLLTRPLSRPADFLWFFIAALIIAGGAEHISVIALLMSTSMLLMARFNRMTIDKVKQRRLLFFAGSLAVLFLLIATNPGAHGRLNDVDQMLAARAPEEPGILLTFFQPYKLIGLLLLFAGIGAYVLHFGKPALRFNIRRLTFLSLLVLVVCIGMSLAAYGRYGPGRIWFPVDACLYLLLAAIVLKRLPPHSAQRVAFISSAVALVATGWYAWKHVPALNEYRRQFDTIAKEMQEAAPGQLVRIDNFPAPDLVSTVELSSDTMNESNRLFCRFYNSKGKVSLSPRK